MQTDKDVLEAAHGATSATRTLSQCTRSTAQTRRLTAAEHADALHALNETIAAVTGAPGLLRSILRVLMERRDFPTEPRPDVRAELVSAFADLYDIADHARIQAGRAPLEPACNRLRADLARLPAAAPRPGPGPRRRNVVVVRAGEATEQLNHLAALVHPDDDSLDDLVTALITAAEVIASLIAACLHEANRITGAYTGLGLGRSGAIVSETVAAAGQALATAHRTLTTAIAPARALAEHERTALVAA